MTAAVLGLRKVDNYEHVLALANKDERPQGLISVGLQREATKMINSPDFQRVKDTLENDSINQTQAHIQQQQFQQNVQSLAVEANINRADLQYIIENLQRPDPPPPPPPPQTDAAADRARLIAELDGMAQEKEKHFRQERIAAENAARLAAQAVATPAQEIIREFHQTVQPIYVPQPAPQPVGIPQEFSEMLRQTGHTVREMFLHMQRPQTVNVDQRQILNQFDQRQILNQVDASQTAVDARQTAQTLNLTLRPPRDEIPITYTNQGGPPPPPGGGRERSGYGPVRKPKERASAYAGSGPPAMPGGATAPLPIADKPRKQVVVEEPIGKGKGEKREVPAAAASRPKKPKEDPPAGGRGYVPRFFQGKSGKLDPSASSSGPARPPPGRGFAPKFGGSTGAGEPTPFNTSRAGYDPFAGRPQRLAMEGVKRMKELLEARNPPPKQLKIGKGVGSQKFFSIGD